MGSSTIEWTNATWNPVRGCSIASPGCHNCYAAGYAARFAGPGLSYEGLAYFGEDGRAHWAGQITLAPHKLIEPLRWREPRMIFANSTSDLFHEGVPDEYIAAVFAVMAACPQHTFQVLTKRAGRLPKWFSWLQKQRRGYWHEEHGFLADVLGRQPGFKEGEAGDRLFRAGLKAATRKRWPDLPDPVTNLGDSSLSGDWPLANVWLGVSVEDQKRANERIPALLDTPAKVRFISAEPLLGPVDLGDFLCRDWRRGLTIGTYLDWIIGGGESGPHARPCDESWIGSLVAQAHDVGIPIFVKQLGAVPVERNGSPIVLRDKKGGDPDEWPEQFRERGMPLRN